MVSALLRWQRKFGIAEINQIRFNKASKEYFLSLFAIETTREQDSYKFQIRRLVKLRTEVQHLRNYRLSKKY